MKISKLLIAISIFMIGMVFSIQSKASSITAVYDTAKITNTTVGITFTVNTTVFPSGAIWQVSHNGNVSQSTMGSSVSFRDTFDLTQYSKPITIYVTDFSTNERDTIPLCLANTNFTMIPDTVTEFELATFVNTSSVYTYNGNQTVEYKWHFGDGSFTDVIDKDSSPVHIFTYYSPSNGVMTVVLDGIVKENGNIISFCSTSKHIVVRDSVVVTSLDIVNEGDKQIFSFNKQLTVNSDVSIRQVQVFNITGQVVADFKADTDRQTFSLHELINGVYIVSVIDANKVITNKRIVVM